jgi:Sec-independent protein translocase protein TatA
MPPLPDLIELLILAVVVALIFIRLPPVKPS